MEIELLPQYLMEVHQCIKVGRKLNAHAKSAVLRTDDACPLGEQIRPSPRQKCHSDIQSGRPFERSFDHGTKSRLWDGVAESQLLGHWSLPFCPHGVQHGPWN